MTQPAPALRNAAESPSAPSPERTRLWEDWHPERKASSARTRAVRDLLGGEIARAETDGRAPGTLVIDLDMPGHVDDARPGEIRGPHRIRVRDKPERDARDRRGRGPGPRGGPRPAFRTARRGRAGAAPRRARPRLRRPHRRRPRIDAEGTRIQDRSLPVAASRAAKGTRFTAPSGQTTTERLAGDQILDLAEKLDGAASAPPPAADLACAQRRRPAAVAAGDGGRATSRG